MPVPEYQAFMRPLLELGCSGERKLNDCMAVLADNFGLSEADRTELLPSGKKTRLYDRIHWAATYLNKAGAIVRPRRGFFITTDRGKQLLSDYKNKLTVEDLLKFDEFKEFVQPGASLVKVPPVIDVQVILDSTDHLTPEERIDSAYQELEESLREDLLEKIIESDPVFFELVILKLMTAMGYGGGRSSAAKMTQKSNDGGVDGVINEDPLGLDTIYLQAKRYSVEKSVGRETVQAFVGALAGFKASKGVFVTTSFFSKPAIEYASHQNLVLIDGRELTRLMVRYGVGVTIERSIDLKKIDTNFFDDDVT